MCCGVLAGDIHRHETDSCFFLVCSFHARAPAARLCPTDIRLESVDIDKPT